MSVENFAKANSPPTEQAHAVLARSRSCCHRATTSTVVKRFFRGTASLYIFSILFSRKSRVPLDAAFSCLFLFISGLLFLPQGLFLPLRFIPSWLFCAAGIISAARIHPYLALFFRRDYFFRPDSSLSCFFFRRDYFRRPDSSLSCSFLPQGLLRPPGFILILLFFSAGIISAGCFSSLKTPLPVHSVNFRLVLL